MDIFYLMPLIYSLVKPPRSKFWEAGMSTGPPRPRKRWGNFRGGLEWIPDNSPTVNERYPRHPNKCRGLQFLLCQNSPWNFWAVLHFDFLAKHRLGSYCFSVVTFSISTIYPFISLSMTNFSLIVLAFLKRKYFFHNYKRAQNTRLWEKIVTVSNTTIFKSLPPAMGREHSWSRILVMFRSLSSVCFSLCFMDGSIRMIGWTVNCV